MCEINVLKTIQAKKREQDVHEEQEKNKVAEGGGSLSQTSSQADLIYYDHSVSMLERTALRVYPIIKEICQRMVKHKDIGMSEKKSFSKEIETKIKGALDGNPPLNMKVLLGYLN